MCLTLKKPSTDIAKRNIVCWKVVNPIKDSVPPQWLPKYINDTGAYEFNKVCKARKIVWSWSEVIVPVSGEKASVRKSREISKRVLGEIDSLEIKLQDDLLTIEGGFHAFRTYRRAKSSGFKFYPCIIPKGSEYGLGIHSDIVSTRIIVFSSFLGFLKYLLLPWTR